jgi:hypothetical protein
MPISKSTVIITAEKRLFFGGELELPEKAMVP